MEENKQPDNSVNENPGSARSTGRSSISKTLAITFGTLQIVWLAWLGWVAWKVLSA
jgi:hypothetical protein